MNAETRALLSRDARVSGRWNLHYRSNWWKEQDIPELFVLEEGLSLSVWCLTGGENNVKVLKSIASVSLPYVRTHKKGVELTSCSFSAFYITSFSASFFPSLLDPN
jgi:hypothetical protein